MRKPFSWMLPVMLGMAAVVAHSAAPVAGRDYTELNPAQPTADAKRVVVTEFFSYQCPHCAAFASTFEAWKKTVPADVVVERVSTDLGHTVWQPAARMYYALSAMNQLGKLDDKIFAAIHQQGVRMDTEEQVTSWVGKQGVDTKMFTSMYRAFGTDAQYRAAQARTRDARIPSIPALLIDGRYIVAIEDMGGGGREAHFREQLTVVNELIGRARQMHARGGAAKPTPAPPVKKP